MRSADQPHQAVTAGHVQVEQDEIDAGLRGQCCACRIDAIGFDDLDVVAEVADGLDQGEAKQRVIVGNEDAGHA